MSLDHLSKSAGLESRRPGGLGRALIKAAVVILLLGGAAWLLWGKASGPAAEKGGNARVFKTSVTVAKAQTRDVKIYLTGLGSVTPLNTTTVKSRVDGQLMEVLFKEGQMVKAGDLLAIIDPRPYQAQLEQSEGLLVRDQAQLENARLDLKRYQQLILTGAIAAQQLDTQVALVHQYEGTVKNDQGQIDNAKLQITYSRITAPFSGRVGLRQVDPGNMIQASNQALLVITQMQPISVIFTIPEDSLPKVLNRMQTDGHLPVEAWDREQKNKLADGELLTMDNQIDQTTGTVKLKAVFANDGWKLFPNQFVNARLLEDTVSGALTVPASAVQRGPQSALVFVVKEDSTVESRPVEIGESVDGVTIVRQGLSAGETVVVEGAERLKDGAVVAVKNDSGSQDAGKAAPDADTNARTKPGAPGGADGKTTGGAARQGG
jgi:multidrug efflux system membrane fusion protein